MAWDALKDLELISKAVGSQVDMVQGGGGNTSVKLDDRLMAVKASGFKLTQITENQGYVVVNYENIKNYYNQVDLSTDTDYEKDSVEFVKRNIVEIEGVKTLRPSVEAGFHSILKKFVIHTHPVYANIVCCAQNGKALAERIFEGSEFGFIWVPYINPGFCLTLKIKEEMEAAVARTGKLPAVVFMENHGLIVTADTSEECLRLHEEVNNEIKKYLKLLESFPAIELEAVDETTVVSKTEYLRRYFKGWKEGVEFFDNTVLYPDQLVYLDGHIAVNEEGRKLNINTLTGEVVYKTNYSEAVTMEQTLLAFLYVVENVRNKGLVLKTLSQREIDFIKNWESEAYRKSLVKELSK